MGYLIILCIPKYIFKIRSGGPFSNDYAVMIMICVSVVGGVIATAVHVLSHDTAASAMVVSRPTLAHDIIYFVTRPLLIEVYL